MIERKPGQRIMIAEVLCTGECPCGAKFSAVLLQDGEAALTHEGPPCQLFTESDPADYIDTIRRGTLN